MKFPIIKLQRGFLDIYTNSIFELLNRRWIDGANFLFHVAPKKEIVSLTQDFGGQFLSPFRNISEIFPVKDQWFRCLRGTVAVLAELKEFSSSQTVFAKFSLFFDQF